MWMPPFVPAAVAAPAQGEAQLRLTALDAPFDLVDGVPSMQQSLDLAWSIERGAMLGVREGVRSAFPHSVGAQKGLGLAVAWGLAFPMTFVQGWSHEEWHRAVMSHRGVSSRNGIWYADARSGGLISVDHVSDADLAALKAAHPADTVRLMSAGMESQHALGMRVGDEAFLHRRSADRLGPLLLGDTFTAPLVFVADGNSALYLLACGPGSDELTDEENRLHPDVASRDFTGLDCAAWAYDVDRPDEPYADRGPHPYGAGVDRYRSWSDLNASEQRLLRTQLALSSLNALDPHLFGVDGFALRDGRFTVRAGHQLAPFGYALELHGGLVSAGRSALATASVFVTADGRAAPGLAARAIDVGLGDTFALDGGASVWMQPRGGRLDGALRPGGQVEAELAWRAVQRLDVLLGVSAKSAGWVPGVVSLDPAVGATLGAAVHVR